MKSPKFSTRRAARSRGDDRSAVPTREQIIKVLNEQGVPVTDEVLEKLLRIRPHQRDAFHAQVAAMEAKICQL